MSKYMDPNIWSNIPDHILDRVLAFLPFWSILEFRCVSKKWRENLTSTSFLIRWDEKSSVEPMFVMFTDCWSLQSAAAYIPSMNKWHPILKLQFNNLAAFHNFYPIATAGGLLCMEVAWPNRSLIVFNPINRSCRNLPPMLHMERPLVVGMVVDVDKTGYKVLVVQDGESLDSQYYDSRTEMWKMNATVDGRASILTSMQPLGRCLFGLASEPTRLISYCIDNAKWCDLKFPMPPSISSPHVLHHNGRLFLVGGVEEHGEVTSIRIWNLDLACKECVEIDQMPELLFHDFSHKASAELFFCKGEAGFVSFSDGLRPPVLLYNLNTMRWLLLPPFPFSLSAPKLPCKYALNLLSPVEFAVKPCFIMNA